MIAAAAKLYSDRGDDVKIACVTSNESACKCYAKLFAGSAPDLTGIRKEPAQAVN